MTAELEIRSLVKSFGSQTVLRGIDLDVASGDVVVVIGPSGSGKSTLLNCINFLEPFEGAVSGSVANRWVITSMQPQLGVSGNPKRSSMRCALGSAWSFSISICFRT